MSGIIKNFGKITRFYETDYKTKKPIGGPVYIETPHNEKCEFLLGHRIIHEHFTDITKKRTPYVPKFHAMIKMLLDRRFSISSIINLPQTTFETRVPESPDLIVNLQDAGDITPYIYKGKSHMPEIYSSYLVHNWRVRGFSFDGTPRTIVVSLSDEELFYYLNDIRKFKFGTGTENDKACLKSFDDTIKNVFTIKLQNYTLDNVPEAYHKAGIILTSSHIASA